jgi:hypothetical protein
MGVTIAFGRGEGSTAGLGHDFSTRRGGCISPVTEQSVLVGATVAIDHFVGRPQPIFSESDRLAACLLLSALETMNSPPSTKSTLARRKLTVDTAMRRWHLTRRQKDLSRMKYPGP